MMQQHTTTTRTPPAALAIALCRRESLLSGMAVHMLLALAAVVCVTLATGARRAERELAAPAPSVSACGPGACDAARLSALLMQAAPARARQP